MSLIEEADKKKESEMKSKGRKFAKTKKSKAKKVVQDNDSDEEKSYYCKCLQVFSSLQFNY